VRWLRAEADLFKKLGLIHCQAGDLDDGERENCGCQSLKPTDPEIQSALQLIAEARKPLLQLRRRKAY